MPCFWAFQNNFLSCQFVIFIQSLWDLFHTNFSHVKFVAKICLAVSLPICNSCAVSIMPNSSQFSHKSSSSPNFQQFPLFSSENFCVIQMCALGRVFLLTSHLANWRFWEQFCSISQEIWHLLVAEFFVKYFQLIKKLLLNSLSTWWFMVWHVTGGTSTVTFMYLLGDQ